jgi:hypothetical protein
VLITAGTNLVGSSADAGKTGPITRRHENSRFALRSRRRANADTDAPRSYVSATIRRFSSSGRTRRRRLAAEPSLETDIYDRVHLGYTDTIIVLAAPSSFMIRSLAYRRPTPACNYP